VVVFFLLVFFQAPSGAIDRDHDPGLLWPLKAGRAISSNFCEYREGHFHAGLDIRTSGADGVPCVASGDGYISRLRASCEGYGKALYIQLDSGETLVYAHLAEFRPDLEEALRAEQQKTGDFRVSARYPRGRFPVKRGDVIAWSGSTGGVPPHLHFEIRDRGENPLNPCLNGFGPEDRLDPVFGRILFLPGDADAAIYGACWPVEPRITRTGGAGYALADTLRINGNVGVAVEVFDRLNAGSGKLAPHRIELLIDDSPVTDIRLERFSFSHAGEVDFLYDMSKVRGEKSYFFQLFESPGESMWNRRFVNGGLLGRTAVRRATGRRIVEGVVFGAAIVATDHAGNRARLDFRFVIEGPASRILPAHAHGQFVDPGGPACLYVRNDFVSGRSPFGDLIVPAAPAEIASASVARAESFRGEPVEIRCGGETAFVFGVSAGEARTVELPAFDLELEYGEGTLFTDIVQYVSRWDGQHSPRDLSPVHPPVRIGPGGAVLAEDLTIRFTGEADSVSAVYRLNERKGEWVFYPSETGGTSISTTAKRPGVYAAFSDPLPPRIVTPVVGQRKSYATGALRPELVIGIEDNGSGVDYKNTTVEVGGKKRVFYWDNPVKKLFVAVGDDNIMGRQKVSITAFDNAGNSSHLEYTVEIPAERQPQGNN
jgi:hypothetical protein